MTAPSWIASRWVIVPGLLTLTVALWNLYLTRHDSGLVEGSVVDGRGQAVAGATVLLFERGFVTHQERNRVVTDASGAFRFTDNRSHSIQLEAEAPGLGRSERRVVRLWFRSQDARLTEPLRLPASRA